MAIVMTFVGIGLVCISILAFTGRWQKWASRTGYAHNAGFSALYWGTALIITGVTMMLPRDAVTQALFFYVGLPILWCGIIGYWWMPRFLLPSWLIHGRATVRSTENAYTRMRRDQKQTQNIRR